MIWWHSHSFVPILSPMNIPDQPWPPLYAHFLIRARRRAIYPCVFLVYMLESLPWMDEDETPHTKLNPDAGMQSLPDSASQVLAPGLLALYQNQYRSFSPLDNTKIHQYTYP